MQSLSNSRNADSGSELTIISPPNPWPSLNINEIWQYRDLLRLLVWRDISTKYRQSVLGIGWAIFRPLASAIIFTIVFSVFVQIKTDAPYPIFAFAALIPWMFFATSLTSITASVVNCGTMLTKVYFPRMLLPLSAIVSGLLEVAIQMGVLALLMLWYGYTPSLAIFALPIFIFAAVLTTFAFGIWLTALNVRYRDVGMAVPFFLQIGIYFCPILYPVSLVPEKYRLIYSLNPMVGVIEGFRWSILGTQQPNVSVILCSYFVVLITLITGMFYFKKAESTFADFV